jgi:hypothetical protein
MNRLVPAAASPALRRFYTNCVKLLQQRPNRSQLAQGQHNRSNCSIWLLISRPRCKEGEIGVSDNRYDTMGK